MNILLNKIKKAYPNPIKAGWYKGTEFEGDNYCVGGAFCQYTGFKEEFGITPRFPGKNILTNAFRYFGAEREEAELYASTIINCNDRKQFNNAWYALGTALERTRFIKGETWNV